MDQIMCENPRIILNPLASDFLARFGCYVYLGKMYHCAPRLIDYSRLLRSFGPKLVPVDPSSPLTSKRVYTLSEDDMDACYFLDTSSGEIFPMYMKVRCGHCDCCQSSKVNSLVHRCKLETMSYKCYPIFFTLTYDNAHLPKDGVSVRDVQLFLKRFRINLERNGYRDKIRYLLVSEYGHGPDREHPNRTSRPHYHGIFWNLHATDFFSYKQIGKVLQDSWGNGFEMHRLVDPGKDQAFFYTAKYLSKGCNVPDGKAKNFMVSSNRGGGIGALFLAVLAPDIRKTLNTNPKFFNRFSGKLEHLQLSKYVLDKLFPTASAQVTSPVRSAVRRFVWNYSALRCFELENSAFCNAFSFDSSYRRVLDYFSRFMFVYEPDHIALSYQKPYDQILSEMTSDEIVLDRFMDKMGIYFDPLVLDDKRHLYLEKFFKSLRRVDPHERGTSFRRLCDYLQQFEVL